MYSAQNVNFMEHWDVCKADSMNPKLCGLWLFTGNMLSLPHTLSKKLEPTENEAIIHHVTGKQQNCMHVQPALANSMLWNNLSVTVSSISDHSWWGEEPWIR